MYIKLVKSFLASTLLLIGMNGTAIGGECETVLERMQNILEERKGGDNAAGTVPSSLRDLPYDTDISIYESGTETIGINRNGDHPCFILKGQWSRDPYNLVELLEAGKEKYPHIKAYVFFKNKHVKIIKNNLRVDSSLPDEGNNRYIALTAKSKEDEYGIVAGASNIQEIKNNIVWLNGISGKQDLAEVVLCEGSCNNIHSLYTENKDASLKSKYQDDLDEQTKTTKEQLEETQRKIEEKIETQLRKEFKSKSRKIGKEAIINFMASKTLFKFVNERGSKLGHKDLKTKECELRKLGGKLTQNDIITFFYKNCVSISDYKILNVKPTIQSGTPIITFKLKKSTPSKIKQIEISVKMEDKSQATQSCAVTAKIVDSSTNKPVFEQPFPFTFDSKEQTLSLEFKKPIAWKGKSLVLEKVEETDCQPKNGELRIPMKEIHVTEKAVLKIPKITLYSTLGNALIVLNTMIGVEAFNEVKSSTQYYPIANDQDSKELFIEMVTQILLQLDGKYKDLIIGYREKNGELIFKDFTSQLENHTQKETAQIIVDFVNFTGNEFNWDTMIRAVNKDTHNRSEYAYRVFIGQSGLSNDKSYCENIPSKQEPLNQDVATYIYDFASDNNDYNPLLKDLKSVDRKFPLLNCPVSNNISVHVVLFPQSKKSGWVKNISTLFSNAFKDR